MSDSTTPPSSPDPPHPQLPHEVGRRRTLAGEQAMVVVQQPSALRGILSWLGWLIAGICLMAIMALYASKQEYFDNSGGVQEKYHSLSKDYSDNKIAVIDASGVIMTGDFVKRQVDQIREDKKIKGIVLRVDSPGGTIYGSDYIYHHLVKLREERELPLVVSMGSMAASGGYYISMAVGDQEKSIYAEPTTTTGSIGVIIPHYDITGLMERFDVKDDSIATHPRKQMLSMTKKLTDDDRQILAKYIGHAFERFKTIIKEGRPKFAEDDAALDELATGEVFTSAQAKDAGLIDEIGFIEEAIDRIIELKGLDKKKTRVVTYKKPMTLMDAFAVGRAKQDGLAQLFELATPKAYYLATSLPTLLTSNP